jgi:hypothetical protein
MLLKLKFQSRTTAVCISFAFNTFHLLIHEAINIRTQTTVEKIASLESLIDGLENDQGEDPEKNAGYHNESAPIKPLE